VLTPATYDSPSGSRLASSNGMHPVTALVLILVLLLAATRAQAEAVVSPFDECVSQIRSKATMEKFDLDLLHRIDAVCYDHVYSLRLLDDFQIRRLKVVEQNTTDFVLLWMVVAITISGVILAGLQLFGSYRLASLGKGEFAQSGEVSFAARGDMSAKSSVTGLLILVVSFAFFLAYIGLVYPVHVIALDPPTGGSEPVAAQSTKVDLRTAPNPKFTTPGRASAPPNPSAAPEAGNK
jgi:hypothetical protein